MGKVKPTIGLIVAMHNRHLEFKYFIQNVESLKKYFDIHVSLVSSNQHTYRMGVEAGYKAILHHQNLPTGIKRNMAVDNAHDFPCDVFFNLADDHLINKEYFDYCLKLISQGYEHVGSIDGYFYDIPTKKMIYWPGYTGTRQNELNGVGKCYTRELFDRMNWVFVDNESIVNLDSSNTRLTNKANPKKKVFRLKDVKGAVTLDIKNGKTLNTIQSLIDSGGESVDTVKVLKKLRLNPLKSLIFGNSQGSK